MESESDKAEIKEEIKVESEFGSILDANYHKWKLVDEPDYEQHEIVLVDRVFSETECKDLISSAEEFGFGYTNYEKSYRGNLRLITDDRSLADAVWKRIEPFLPREVTEGGQRYEVMGLNNCWRLAKYFPGDRFGAHVDAIYSYYDEALDTSVKSMFTVNIYMNGEFEGGETIFNLDKKGSKVSSKRLSITPAAGLCLIFRQPPTKKLLHEGAELKSGLKYLFRSDVMCKSLGSV